MLKYVDTAIVMAEVPDEVSLAINISNCPCNCIGCHSSYLAKDIGESLSYEVLTKLATEAEGITCIAFMGGDIYPKSINKLAKWTKDQLDLKVAWYSGRDVISKEVDINNFDYIKVGHYDDKYGPLNNRKTNQSMVRIDGGKIVEDITYKFRRK